MDFKDIDFDINDEDTQRLLSKIFARTKELCFEEMEKIGPLAQKAIKNSGHLSTKELEDVRDSVMCVARTLTGMIETGRLLKDVSESILNELISIREGFLKGEGKLSLAVLVRQYKENQ